MYENYLFMYESSLVAPCLLRFGTTHFWVSGDHTLSTFRITVTELFASPAFTLLRHTTFTLDVWLLLLGFEALQIHFLESLQLAGLRASKSILWALRELWHLVNWLDIPFRVFQELVNVLTEHFLEVCIFANLSFSLISLCFGNLLAPNIIEGLLLQSILTLLWI